MVMFDDIKKIVFISVCDVLSLSSQIFVCVCKGN